MDWKCSANFGKLSVYLPQKAGRNKTGKITVRHRGGGNRRVFKILDRWRALWNTPGVVLRLEPGNTYSLVALVAYPLGVFTYILAPEGLKVGDTVIAAWVASSTQVGNSMPLLNIPLNIKVHNIESFPGSGAVFARAPGSWGFIIESSPTSVVVILKSGVKKSLSPYCTAVIGKVSSITRGIQKFTKAGHKRLLGIRPTVRGVAMNPVDHPHGGGKGKKSKNPVAQSPWGRLGKGQKTARH